MRRAPSRGRIAARSRASARGPDSCAGCSAFRETAEMSAVDWVFVGVFALGLVVILVRGAYELGIIEGEYRTLTKHDETLRRWRVSGDR